MVRVFCDFDGTVCTRDIGENFFRDFAGERAIEIVRLLIKGEINAREWLQLECEAIPSLHRKEFEQYIDQYSVDPYFVEFIRSCEKKNVAVTILSDGLDLYIKRVLSNAGLDHVSFFSNRAEFIGTNGTSKIAVTFPYTDAECYLCGNCKRNHMLSASADEDIIVYVGDGFSDRCPVRYADFVFAKRHLIKYCQEQNITYFDFNNFDDVQKKMDEIVQRKRIRHRQEAAMARREVFLQG
jgi:2-hydroxy-3-keto-5-methylthiopentenyl-1-phosphate phosphatase